VDLLRAAETTARGKGMGAVDSAVASSTLAQLVAPVPTAYRDASRSVVYGELPCGLRLPPLRSDLLQNGDADTRGRKWRPRFSAPAS
jgi:hypothetical protein